MDMDMEELCGQGEPMDVFTAASLGFLGKVKELSQQRNVDILNEEGWTPLLYAVFNNRMDVTDYLIQTSYKPEKIKSQCNINGSRKSISTAFILAVIAANFKTVRLLYSKEIVDLKDCADRTALHWAVLLDQYEIAEFLLTNGASPALICDGFSYIEDAARRGNKNMVELLLKHGGYFNRASTESNLFELAFKSGDKETMKLILGYIRENYSFEGMIKQLGFEEFWSGLRKNNINYSTFLSMTESDLQKSGVVLMGPRKMMCIIISLLKQLE